MDAETKKEIESIHAEIAKLKATPASKANGTKHGPHAVFNCPICEQPSRMVLEENNIAITCSPCRLIIKLAGSVIKYDVDAMLEHGKIEPLRALCGTKEIDDLQRELNLAQNMDPAKFGSQEAKDNSIKDIQSAIATAAIKVRDERRKAALRDGSMADASLIRKPIKVRGTTGT